jgi:hypothetical protein
MRATKNHVPSFPDHDPMVGDSQSSGCGNLRKGSFFQRIAASDQTWVNRVEVSIQLDVD